MQLLKKPKIAVAAMILMILCSAIFGNYRSLLQLSHKVEAVFYQGEQGDGLGIQNDLEKRIDLAYNMVTIARKYLPESDQALNGVLIARETLLQAKSPAEKYKANQRLTEATTDLSAKLAELKLSATDERYRASLYQDLSSRNSIMSHDNYNNVAEDFNQVLRSFPSNVINLVFRVEPAELYQ